MRRLTSDGGTFDSSKKIPEHYSFDRKMVVGKSRILYSLNNMIRVKANAHVWEGLPRMNGANSALGSVGGDMWKEWWWTFLKEPCMPSKRTYTLLRMYWTIKKVVKVICHD